jgi:hypothetical protein
VQEAFVNKIHGKDIEDFFLAARKAMGTAKNLQPLEGWKDYTVINKMYQKVYNLIYKAPCHVLLTAEATSVSNDTDSREIRDMFGRIGQRPKGQKRLPFVPHTVLYLKKSGRDSYVYTTVKDRQREDQVDAELSDFAKDYLWAVAGWRPRRAS